MVQCVDLIGSTNCSIILFVRVRRQLEMPGRILSTMTDQNLRRGDRSCTESRT